MADEVFEMAEVEVKPIPRKYILAKRALDVTIRNKSGSESWSFKGLRVLLTIAWAGGDAMGVAQGAIYGLRQSDLINLTQIGTIGQANVGRYMSITARSTNANGEVQEVLVHTGQIVPNQIYADFNQQPEVPLIFMSNGAMNTPFIKPAPLSMNGQVSVADIMRRLAELGGFKFINNGVTESLENAYFAGSLLDQIRATARAAGINFSLENEYLFIWPRSLAGRGDPVIELNQDTGLIGYPTFAPLNLIVQAIYSPLYKIGSQVNLNSPITVANGKWQISMVQHQLETEKPEGAWFSTLYLFKVV